MKLPKVTIVILNYNGANDTRECLKSLLKTRYHNLKIIVVDNGSKINEAEILEKEFPNKKINFIRLSKNLGFSGGNNRVLLKIKSKYAALLNNDTIVSSTWLSPLVEIMEKDKSIAIAQPKILWAKNKKFFDYAGACGGFIDVFGHVFTKGRIFNTIEMDKKQYNSMSNIFWASGAAMLIRKNIFDELGYFDERFFNYMEEIDLCYRIQQADYRIVYQPNSYIYHKVASTAAKKMFKKRFWEHRNNLLLMLKNYPLFKLILFFPIRILFEYISMLYYLYIKRFDYALAVLLSQLSLISMSPLILYQRLHTKQKENDKMKKLIYQKSIVVSYFLLNKKRFSDLSYYYSD